MKSNKLNYIIVGGFVSAVIIGLLISISLLTGQRGDAVTYYTVYDNVTGLKYGTRVLYEGFRIGQVETIEPFEVRGQMRFRIVMSIREDWRIPDDSVARVEAPTLLSPIVINVHAGESTTPLEAESEITSEEASNIFAAISSVAGQVAELSENIKPVLATIDRTVGSIGDILEGDGGALVGDLRKVTAEISISLPGILGELEATAGEIRKFTSTNSDGVSNLVANANEAVDNADGMITNIDNVVKGMDGVADDLRDTLALVQGMVANLDGLVVDNGPEINAILADLKHTSGSLSRHIDAINQNIEGTSRNAFELSRRLRRDPSLLVRGGPDDDEGQPVERRERR